MSKDKQSIQVTIRVRPLSQKQKHEDNRICVDVEHHTHSIQTFYANQNKKFTFDSIADNNTQHDMFLKVGKKSTLYCLEGYNCTIFAYGQTGSGKTFTMMGVDSAHDSYDELRGLIPRTLEYLFESIDMQIKQTSSEYIIRCSFLQIYNQQIIDLLNPKNNSNLQIRQDIKKGVYVEGITEQTIFKGEQALEILKKGSKGRHVGSTCYNEASSRSHSVFTMQIESKHTKNGVVNTKIRYFHFIDLAGSQRTKQINGERLKQGCSINKSLHVLGKVINSLAESSQSKPRHINYRDSKLTFLLKDSLGGNSKTHLIANISPCAMSYSETNMTLAFARRVKLIKVNKASINEDMSGNLEGLKNQIKRLKQQVIMLRNGGSGIITSLESCQSLNEVSENNGVAPTAQQNSKMIQILNRYVSQQLDKQTKFQGEMSKLHKKLDCLQNAIKKYAENQIHLKMIISVYQDKVKRTKNVQNLFSPKIDQLNSQTDESTQIIAYFKQQRLELIKETESYKNILSENSNALLKLLKSCKAYQPSSKDDTKQDLINLLKSNTDFLNVINAQLKEIRQVQLMGVEKGQKKTVQEVIDEKMALIDLEFNKKETELVERVEQLQLEINEFKSASEESEMLLKDSVNREINLEEEIRQREEKIRELEESVRRFEEGRAQEALKVKIYEQQLEQLREQNVALKRESEQKSLELQELKKKQVQQMRLQYQRFGREQRQRQQLRQLRDKKFELQEKVSQIENKLVDSIKEYEDKVFELEEKYKTIQSKQSQVSRELLEMKQRLQQQQHQAEELTYSHKRQVQDMVNALSRLQTQTIRHQKQLHSSNDTKAKIQEKLKNQLQKSTSLNQQLQHKQQQLQKTNLTLIHLQHDISAKTHKITHLQTLVKDKQQQEENYTAKSKLKEEELLQMINQMQTSSDSSSQQFNRIRIELVHLKQTKSQQQLKNHRLNQEIKQLATQITTKTNKIQQLNTDLQEKTKKLLLQKEQTTKKKQLIRNLTYSLEQAKSQSLQLHNTILLKDQQFEELHAKNISLFQQSTHTKKELNSTKLQLKQLETKLFCLEKSTQIQKDALNNQTDKKIHQLNQTLNSKITQIKKLQKTIHQQKLHLESITAQSSVLKQTNTKNQTIFRNTLQKQLFNKATQTNLLKSTITSLQDQLETLNSTHQHKKQQLEQSISQLQAQQKTRGLEVQSLKMQVKANEQNIQQKQLEVKTLQQLIEQLKSKHERELEDLEIEHNQQIDSKNQQIDTKNEQISSKIQYINTKDQQITIKIQQINIKDHQINNKNRQIVKLNDQIALKDEQLSQKIIELTRKQKQMSQKCEQLKAKHEQIQSQSQKLLQSFSQINQLTQTLQNQYIKIQQLETSLNQTQTQTTLLQRQLNSKDELLNQTQSETHQKHTQIVLTLNTAIQEKETLLQSVKEGNQKLVQEKAIIFEQKCTLRDQLRESSEKVDQLQQQMESLQSEVSKVEQQMSGYKSQAQELQQQLQKRQQREVQTKAQNRSLQTAIHNLTNQLSLIQEQINLMTGQIHSLKQELSQSCTLNQQHEALISSLNQQLYELQKTHTQQSSQLVPQLNKEISTGRCIIDSKQEQIHLLNTSIKELHQQLEEVKRQKVSLEDKCQEAFSHNETLEVCIEELNQKLNQINAINNDTHSSHQHLKQQHSTILEQLRQQRATHLLQHTQLQTRHVSSQQHCNQLQSSLTSHQHQLHTLELSLKSQQTTCNQLAQQKQELTQSYKSLQQINKGLGRKCEEMITNLEDQKTEYRKLQTKYLGEKTINQNLKQLLQNSQLQKKHLATQLKDKTQIYNKLVQKISKNESLHADRQKKSQHYLKTVDLLEKSRFEQLELRKLNQDLKRQSSQLRTLAQKKQQQLKQTTKKHESLQTRLQSFESDYLELQSKYQQLLQNKKIYDQILPENTSLKLQLDQTKPKLSRMTLKIQQLEQRIRSINEEYIELQNENHDLKKKILYPGTADQRTSMYINKLKSEINDLKKQKLILEDTLKKQTSQKMKLKTDAIKNPPDSNQTQSLRHQLEKRLTEIRYLQQIIAEMIDILKIKQFEQGSNPKSIKIQSIRKGIVTSIKQKIQENKYLKERIHEIESRLNINIKEKENKSISSIVYNGLGSQSQSQSQSSAKKESSFTQSSQKIERREKSFSTKEDQISSMMRNKMSSSISGQQLSQQKREKKGLNMDGLRNLIENDESNLMNTREKMKVKEIVTNSGKFYKNLQ